MCYAGILMSLALLVSFLLVVECDMPWKEGLEAKYGDSFRPWAEEDFQEAIGNITAALPHNHLTTIVSFVFLTLLSRPIIRPIKGNLFARCLSWTISWFKIFICIRLVCFFYSFLI